MHLLLAKHRNTTELKAAQKLLDRRGITYETTTFREPIRFTGRYPDETYFQHFADLLYPQHGYELDGMAFFVPLTQWETDDLNGVHYREAFRTYRATALKLKEGYEKVLDHELLHMAAAIIYIYTGKRLGPEFGVSNFAKVIHGDAPGFEEYDYDEVWEVVKPYLDQAIENRRTMGEMGISTKTIITLRGIVDRFGGDTCPGDVEKPITHPVARYKERITQDYGVADVNRYPLTGHHIGVDYGAPEGTPVRAPADGRIVKSGRTQTLGNYVHYRYQHHGRTYTMRALHLSSARRTGTYKQGQIIGRTGDSGDSTGPHVHVDCWHGDVQLDTIGSGNWQSYVVNPEMHYGNA